MGIVVGSFRRDRSFHLQGLEPSLVGHAEGTFDNTSFLSNFGVDCNVSTFDKIIGEIKYAATTLTDEFGFLAKVKKKCSFLSRRILGKQSQPFRCPLIMAALLCGSPLQGLIPKELLCALVNSWFCFWKISLGNKYFTIY